MSLRLGTKYAIEPWGKIGHKNEMSPTRIMKQSEVQLPRRGADICNLGGPPSSRVRHRGRLRRHDSGPDQTAIKASGLDETVQEWAWVPACTSERSWHTQFPEAMGIFYNQEDSLRVWVHSFPNAGRAQRAVRGSEETRVSFHLPQERRLHADKRIAGLRNLLRLWRVAIR